MYTFRAANSYQWRVFRDISGSIRLRMNDSQRLFRILIVTLVFTAFVSMQMKAVSVTFKVDMSQQVISPDGVHLAGNFQGWDPSSTLMTDIGGGLYCIVLDLPPGVYQFKFINGNSWGNDEIVPSACGVDDGGGIMNRQIVVGSGPFVMPEVCFASCSVCPPPGYVTNGNSSYLGGDCYAVTTAGQWQNGTIWNNTQIDLSQNFNLQFALNLGSDDNGADGVVFVLQRLGTMAIGASGGGMGYSSFGTSLGIEFDTFYNPEFNDPVYDHAAIEVNGNVDHFSALQLAGPVQMSPFNTNVEDGVEHVVQINWNTSSHQLEVYFDCQLILTQTIDLVNDLFGGENLVYWGFTGATGAYFNSQQFCIQPAAMIAETVSTCPGAAVQLNAGASATLEYNWTPATDLNNPTIANPLATPSVTTTYTVTTTDLCGALTARSITVEVLENNPACALLPVSLMNFDVKTNSDQLYCSWKTLSESSNSYFTIQESTNNFTYNDVYTTGGAGNSIIPINYSVILKRNQKDAYYRLTQTDFNGVSNTISNVIFVPGDSGKNIAVYADEFSGSVIVFYEDLFTADRICIYSVVGTPVHCERPQTRSENRIELNPQLSFGIYFVRILDHSGNEVASGKFIAR